MNGNSDLIQDFLSSQTDDFSQEQMLCLVASICGETYDSQRAKQILNDFGGLANLLDCSYSQLKSRLGDRMAAAIGIINGLSSYKENSLTQESRIVTVSDAVLYAHSLVRKLKSEVFIAVFLNSDGRVLSKTLCSQYKQTGVTIDVREIISKALLTNCASALLIHNHPGGTLKLSDDDVNTTKSVYYALQGVGVALFDHVVLTKEDWLSFSNQGHIKRYKEEYETTFCQEI